MTFTEQPPTARLKDILRAPAGPAPLLLLTCPVLLAGIWTYGSPGLVLSREMTWDLLFNLAGAWHLDAGHVAHVDFHDPVGRLYFLATAVGFKLVGPTVFAAIVGKFLVALAVFAAGIVVSVRCLPGLPAFIFVSFVTAMALMPVNVGDPLDAFTFAMTYNVQAWAMLAILSLLLFVPPFAKTRFPGLGPLLGGVLILMLFELKITYFAAALAQLAVAFAVSRHVQRDRHAWTAVVVALLLNVVAPYNWPYLADIRAAVDAGGAALPPGHVAATLRTNAWELAAYGSVFASTLVLWRFAGAPARLPAAAATLVALGILLLVFNTQASGMPLGLVMFFVLYAHLCRRAFPASALLALLLWPTAVTVLALASLVAYRAAALRTGELFADGTWLRGLAVPIDRASANGEPSQADYLRTLIEAAALLESATGRGGGIALLDQVNPMPFVVARKPQRGAMLWLDPAFPWPVPDRMFAGIDQVLIPKSPTYRRTTERALELYGDYLVAHFPSRAESPGWTLFSR